MQSLIQTVVESIPKIVTNFPKYQQYEILKTVAGKLGMLEAQSELGTSSTVIHKITSQCRGFEATLFRLKQIESLLSMPGIPEDEKKAIIAEKGEIMERIHMPSGVPINEFAGESEAQATMVRNLMCDLESCRVCLS